MTYKLESTHLKDDIVIKVGSFRFQDSDGQRRRSKAPSTIGQSQQRL